MPRKIVDSAATTPLREIVPIPQRNPIRRGTTGRACPSCGGDLTRGPVPCPDGKPGCLVNHQGMQCSSCGKYWH